VEKKRIHPKKEEATLRLEGGSPLSPGTVPSDETSSLKRRRVSESEEKHLGGEGTVVAARERGDAPYGTAKKEGALWGETKEFLGGKLFEGGKESEREKDEMSSHWGNDLFLTFCGKKDALSVVDGGGGGGEKGKPSSQAEKTILMSVAETSCVIRF